MDWQPIATAPRDGTIILAAWAETWGTDNPHAELCYFDNYCEDGAWFYAYDTEIPAFDPTHWVNIEAPK